MKNKIVILICIFLTAPWNMEAQNYLSKIPLPSGNFNNVDLRLRTFIKEDPTGNIWLGFGTKVLGTSAIFTSKIGLAKYSNSNWTIYNQSNSSIPTNSLTCIGFQGAITWIGSLKGLIKFDGTTFTNYTVSNSGLASDTINDICVNGSTIWIATNNGISKMIGSTIVSYKKTNSNLSENIVKVITSNDNLKVYLGTYGGLFCFENGVFKNYNKLNSGLLSNHVTALYHDQNATLWISADSSMEFGQYVSSIHTLKNELISPLQGYTFKNCPTLRNQPKRVFSICGMANGGIYFPSFEIENPSGASLQTMTIFEVNSTTLQQYLINLIPRSQPYFMAASAGNKLLVLASDGVLDSIVIFNPSLYKETNPKNSVSYLNINKLNLPISPANNLLFWDKYNNSHFEAPAGTCKSPIFAASLWVAGKSKDTVYAACQMTTENFQFGTPNSYDYFPGPLDTISGFSTLTDATNFSRSWKINRSDIESFKNNFANGNVANGSYILKPDFISWPAHGQGNHAKNLAPFVDNDGDGNYNPMKGDYPKIRGDQMIYWITNDNPNYDYHFETQALPLGIEVHGSAYAFQCNDFKENDSNSLINYTSFFHYDIINRGKTSYDSLRIGMFVKNELGNYKDNYIECNPIEGFAFCYNGDSIDEGAAGYGVNPPAISSQILKRPKQNSINERKMDKFIYFNNDFSVTGYPNRPEHFWNYLGGYWKDSWQITYGNNGRGSSDTASFMYPGSHDPALRPTWNESESGNSPGERRYLISTTNLTMIPNEKLEYDFAIIYNRKSGEQQIIQDNRMVKKWFNENSFPTCLDMTTNLNEKANSMNMEFMIYPNPNNGIFTIDFKNMNGTKKITVFNLLGTSIQEFSTNEKQIEISLSNSISGVFILKVENLNHILTRKIVIH